MRERYFVNEAVDYAIENYIDSYNARQDGVLYNSFLVVVIRILALIYGKLDILNPYYIDNTVAFFNNLGKYGIEKANLTLFTEELLSYYKYEEDNKNRKIRVKNPYFKTTLQYLIDMFIAKKKSVNVSLVEEEKFLELIYSTHTKNPYRISEGYFMIGDSLYTEKYYYSKLNGLELTREIDLEGTITSTLNLDALKAVGINLSNLQKMSSSEIEKAKSSAYDYFSVDASKVDRENNLTEKLSYYKMYGHKVTSGNGYVDILLLMSVIITSLSIIAIILFSII